MTITAEDVGKKVSELITVPADKEIDTITLGGTAVAADYEITEEDADKELVATFKDTTPSNSGSSSSSGSSGSSDPSDPSGNSSSGSTNEEEKKTIKLCPWDSVRSVFAEV